MKKHLEDLNLIDLLSEKHLALRKRVNELDQNHVNKTETHILAVLADHKSLSISEISRLINISRQGTHKSIKGLLTRGYVEVADVKDNQRDRYIVLTDEGVECNDNLLNIKRRMEEQILRKLGEEKINLIKDLLKEDWLDDEDPHSP